MPCFPPLAIVFAVGLAVYFEAGKSRSFSVVAWVLAIISALGGLFLLLTGLSVHETIRVYDTSEGHKWLLGSLSAFSFAFLIIWSIRMRDYQKKMVFYCAAIMIFFFMASFVLPNSAMDRRTPGKLLERNLSRVTPNTIMVSNDNVLRAVCWFFKREDIRLLGEPGELTYGLKHDDNKSEKSLNVDDLKEMIYENRGKRQVVLVLIKDHYRNYTGHLPAPIFTDADNHFVFAVY